MKQCYGCKQMLDEDQHNKRNKSVYSHKEKKTLCWKKSFASYKDNKKVGDYFSVHV